MTDKGRRMEEMVVPELEYVSITVRKTFVGEDGLPYTVEEEGRMPVFPDDSNKTGDADAISQEDGE